jgi:hypothetical protein
MSEWKIQGFWMKTTWIIVTIDAWLTFAFLLLILWNMTL